MTISWRTPTFATNSDGSGSVSPLTVTKPTSTASGDLWLLASNLRPYSITETVDQGLSSVEDFATGTTAAGTGSGSLHGYLHTKTATGFEAASVTVTPSTYYTLACHMVALYKTNSGAWTTDSCYGSLESTDGQLTTYDPYGNTTLGFTAGDTIVCFVMHKDDDATHQNTPTITVPGCTVGTVTQRAANASTTGNDTSQYVYSAEITAGTATGPPRLSVTLPVGEVWGFTIFILVREPSSGVSGSATVTGAGSVSATAFQTVNGSASVAGSGSISTVVTQSVTAPEIAGTGSVSASGAVAWMGTGTVAGSGSVSAAGTVTKLGTATVTGVGSTSATHLLTKLGTSSAAGVGSVSATPTLIVTGTATVTGAGAVSASGSVGGGTVTGDATVTGAGSVSASASVLVPGAASVAGTGATSAAASVIKLGTATVTGTGATSATHILTKFGTSTVAGVGAVSASGSVEGGTVSGEATVAGVGSVSAAASVIVPGSATVAGVGVVTAAGTKIILGAAIVTGEGSVAASGGVPGGVTDVDASEIVIAGDAYDPSPWVLSTYASNYANANATAYNATTNGKDVVLTGVATAAGAAYNATTPTVDALAECAEATALAGDAFEIYAETAFAETSIAQYMPMVASNNTFADAGVATAIGEGGYVQRAMIEKGIWHNIPVVATHDDSLPDIYGAYPDEWGKGWWGWPTNRDSYFDGYQDDFASLVHTPTDARAAHGRKSVYKAEIPMANGVYSSRKSMLQVILDDFVETIHGTTAIAYYYLESPPVPYGTTYWDGVALMMLNNTSFAAMLHLNGNGCLNLWGDNQSYIIEGEVPMPVGEWVRLECWAKSHYGVTDGVVQDAVGYAMYLGESTTPLEEIWYEYPTNDTVAVEAFYQYNIGFSGHGMPPHYIDSIQIVDDWGPGNPHPWPFADGAPALATASAFDAMVTTTEPAVASAQALDARVVTNTTLAYARTAYNYGGSGIYTARQPTIDIEQGGAEAAASAFNPTISISATADAQVASASATAYTITGTNISFAVTEAIAVGTAHNAASANTYVIVPDSIALATAFDATVTVLTNTTAATGAATAYQPTALVEPTPTTAVAAAISYDAVFLVIGGATVYVPTAYFTIWALAPTIKRSGSATAPAPNLTITAIPPAVLTYQTANAEVATASALAIGSRATMGGGVSAPAPDAYISAPRPRVIARRRVRQYTFATPVYEDYMGVNSLFFRMDRDSGVSILVENGEVKEVISPRDDRARAAEHYYPGGHNHVVGQDEADILTTAGYLVTETDPEWIEEVLV